jgi:hypothetical protein
LADCAAFREALDGKTIAYNDKESEADCAQQRKFI